MEKIKEKILKSAEINMQIIRADGTVEELPSISTKKINRLYSSESTFSKLKQRIQGNKL